MKLPVVLFVFCLGLISLAQSNTQSSHQGHGQPVIDGSQSPELIPDLAAYRLFLVVAAHRPGSTAQNDSLSQAQLRKLGLNLSDAQTFVSLSQKFISDYENLIRRYNESTATSQGASKEEYAIFLSERDSLVQAVVDALHRELSAEGSKRVDFLVNSEKRHMKVAVSR